MPSTPDPKSLRILLVEDNIGDVRLLQETLRGSRLPTAIDVVRDGMDALAYLRHQGEHRYAPVPDLILLDLGLPRIDGRKVLAEVRSDPELNGIPVVIFTASPADNDVLLAFNFHADGYIRKPLELEAFHDLVRRLGIEVPVGTGAGF
jgi:chemotaxis family two-component system response regulator Rcp1